MKASTFRNIHVDPPKINVDLPKLSELPCSVTMWRKVQLPIDILLLTVKDVDFLSCYYYINDPFKSYLKELGFVYFGNIGGDKGVKLKVALINCSEGSNFPGGTLTVVTQLRPKAVFSVGHCSGMNQESTKLGDVVVSEELTTYSYQEVTKKFCGFKTPVSRHIAELIECAGYGWNPPLANPKERKVEVHCGEILIGSKLVQAEWQQYELLKSFPGAIAIETEGEGILSAARDLKIREWVIIRGISGYADGTEANENWQTFASVTAASFVVSILNRCSIFEDWPHYQGGSTEHLLRLKVKRLWQESSPSDALTPKEIKIGFAGGPTKHFRRPKVKRCDEESSPSDTLNPKKRKSRLAVKQGVPSDEDLVWLSQRLEKWKAIGRRLKIEEARLTAFDHENKFCSEKIYKMLQHWKERNDSAATYMVLQNALCHPLINRKDLAEQLGANSNLSQFITAATDPIPDYIQARGPVALEAYRRALETGETFDRRTKIVLIGQDRVGKTSLRRYLRGEAFDKDEASTNGIEMISPVKNAGKGAWRNPAPLENTSALDHKCAELVAQELLSSSEEPTRGKGATQERSNDDLALKEVINRNVSQEVKSERKPDEVPKKVLSLVDRGLKGNDISDNEGIWPFVWDFAGQAVYHAILPIFLSPQAIYVLVSDLTKELSAPAQCRVRLPNHDEIVVNSPYVEDTNLDHMMRWLDLVHSLGRSEFQRKPANTKDVLPPVVLVGTHADLVRNPSKEMKSVKEIICSMAHPATLHHISKESFLIDNTNPNREDDPQIVSLRTKLLNLSRKMPHISKVIPMQWLRVEQKVDEMVKEKGMHYVGKKRFTEDIFGGICQLNDTNDVEELLHFLQARGRVIYQDRPENPDGLVVLDPQWLIKVLCEIITVSPPWENHPVIQRDYQVLGKEGLLSQQLLNRAFEHLELNDIRGSLIHIMESFDVICNSKNCKGEDYPFFVPCMLKSPKKNTRDANMPHGPLPVFLTFNTNYIPSGLFCRLVVHFLEWASQLRGSCIAPSLFANAARFNVSEVYQLTLECHKTVIKLKIWTLQDSDKMEEKRICEELLSHLERSKTRLSVTCPWLRSVAIKLSVKCSLCEPCPDKCRDGTNICLLHKKEGCSHFDCGHYIPLRSFGLSCEHSVDDVPDYPAEKLDPWVQALESTERKKRTGDSTKHLPQPKVKRRDKELFLSAPLTPKKGKTLLEGDFAKHLPRPKVKRRVKELFSSDALTPKKRKTLLEVKQRVFQEERYRVTFAESRGMEAVGASSQNWGGKIKGV